MTLQEFLNQNVVDDLCKEISVSDRFIDENGKIMKFKIKAINQKKLNELKRRASSYDKSGKLIVNEGLLSCICVIENTVYPNFKDMESIRSTGCNNAEEYLNKVMLAGEIEKLAREIFKISGFGQSLKDLTDEVKN